MSKYSSPGKKMSLRRADLSPFLFGNHISSSSFVPLTIAPTRRPNGFQMLLISSHLLLNTEFVALTLLALLQVVPSLKPLHLNHFSGILISRYEGIFF